MFRLNRSRWVWILSVVHACVCAAASARPALAWGLHPDITRAALRVVPNMEKWEESLGKENIAAVAQCCWMPDWRGQDLGVFYADDYRLTPTLPYHGLITCRTPCRQ